MPGNINSKIPQLLNQTPNFRTAGADFLRNFCSANNYGGVSDEQAHDASQPGVRLWPELVRRGRSRPRTSVWPRLLDAGIMKDGPRNSNRGRCQSNSFIDWFQ